jgi:hypothetical protein
MYVSLKKQILSEQNAEWGTEKYLPVKFVIQLNNS